MDVFGAIQTEKIALLDELDKLFSASTIEGLAPLPQAINAILSDALKRCVVKYSTEIFGADPPRTRDQLITVGGVDYDLEFAHDFSNEGNLIAAILIRSVEIGAAQRAFRNISVRLAGSGMYSSITLQIPALLAQVNDDALKQFSFEIFSLGYNWLNERIIVVIRKACENTNRRLYEYVRIMVPNKKLLEGFLFSAAKEGCDFVVLDEYATRSALDLATARSPLVGRSAADIVLQMMSEIVPIDDSVIRDAVQQTDSIEIDLTSDPYYQKDTTFSQALRAVWGKSVICLPIVSEEPVFLVAFYLPEYRAELEPLLLAHRNRLKAIAAEQRREIGISLELVERFQRGPSGSWGGFLGELMGGFVKTAH